MSTAFHCNRINAALAAFDAAVAAAREDLAAQAAQFGRPKSAPPEITAVMELVAGHYHVPISAILSPLKSFEFAHPRQVAMWLAKRLTSHPGTMIARAFRRDRGTVKWAIRMIDARRETDPDFAREMEVLTAAAKRRIDELARLRLSAERPAA